MTFVSNLPGSVSTVTAPPNVAEIAVPFSVDTTGNIATITDPVARAAQHLIDVALTAPGERVMRPTYGIGIQRMLFENATLAEYRQVAQALQMAYSIFETGSLSNIAVSVLQIGAEYVFQVRFTLDQAPQVHQAVFNYAGQLVGSS